MNVENGNRNNELLAEYNSLREEILQKIELRNTLLICMYTVTVTLLGFSLSEGVGVLPNGAFLSLLPIVVVVPVSLRIGYYRDTIAKMSAYLMVFIEPKLNGISWELRNDVVLRLIESEDLDEKPSSKLGLLLNKVRYADFPVICLACVAVFIFKGGCGNSAGWVLAIAALVITVFEGLYVYLINDITRQKEVWCCRWERIRREECGDNELGCADR